MDVNHKPKPKIPLSILPVTKHRAGEEAAVKRFDILRYCLSEIVGLRNVFLHC